MRIGRKKSKRSNPSPENSYVTKKEFKSFEKIVDERFNKVDARFDKMDARFDKMDSRFDKMAGMMMRMFQTLEQRIKDGVESIRVYNESLKSEINTVSEGVDLNCQKLENHEKRIKKLEDSAF